MMVPGLSGDWDLAHLIAFASAIGWASGVRLYLVVFLTGLSASFGWLPIPPGIAVLQHPAILLSSGFMLFVEFFADKIPGIDSLWDLVHSVIRVPAGAALAAGVFSADSAVMGLVAGILGGTLSAASFTTKATVRAAVNTSPEPFSNIGLSLLEDAGSVGILWLAVTHPILFAGVLLLVLALSVYLVALLFKYLRAIGGRVLQWIGAGRPTPKIEGARVSGQVAIATANVSLPGTLPQVSARFCKECGKRASRNATFCAGCGSALRAARPEPVR